MAIENEVIKLNAEMKARSDFFDRVTHDIKSPLSAVIGAAEILRARNGVQERENYLGVIQRSCNAVIAMIDDILGHSRGQAGQYVSRIEIFSIPQLMTDIEKSVNAGLTVQNPDIRFSLSVSEDVPARVDGDKQHLSQLLVNLLTNAIKFTDRGRVSMSVDTTGSDGSWVFVRWIIEDTGIGMSDDFLLKAFQPYVREVERAGNRPGFGLGLSICKQIVEQMGGTITASSVPGQGSTFTVVLPFALHQ